MRIGRARIAPEAAEELAIAALAFVAQAPDRLASFLAATGLQADAIRLAAQEPGFLAGVIEHILGDENLLIAFAQSAGIDPADVARAAAVLGSRSQRDPE